LSIYIRRHQGLELRDRIWICNVCYCIPEGDLSSLIEQMGEFLNCGGVARTRNSKVPAAIDLQGTFLDRKLYPAPLLTYMCLAEACTTAV
jgi:hypothetical protein